MEILGGLAKGMTLKVPAGREVRPTSVRSRRALFDMFGDLTGKHFCDFFAGSGAVGIEAASRGASHVLLVEKAPAALAAIRDNVKHAQASCPETVFQILPGPLPECLRKLTAAAVSPDIIFADPPYAESAGLLDGILRNGDFSEWAGDALLLWELPDYRSQLKVFPENWKLKTIRELGASRFLLIERRKNGE
ncbi:MAG: RsmD family RNA methyltransferase [Lentisphaeria bacterium]|nr:RsmD family RNA methyltransferase [Lentisphaeria bacterium]